MWRILLIAVLVSGAVLPVVRANDELEKQITEKLSALKETLPRLLENHGSDHPSVIRLKQQIAELDGERRLAVLENLQKQLLHLVRMEGPTSPKAIDVRKQIASLLDEPAAQRGEPGRKKIVERGKEPVARPLEGEQISPNRLLVVLAKQNAGSTLKQARIRTIGGRTFIVGIETEAPKQLTKNFFNGMTVWIPLDQVTQMVEMSKEAKKKSGE